MRKLFVSFIVVIISITCLTRDSYCFSFFNWSSFFDTKNERKIADEEDIKIEQEEIIDAIDIFKKKIENIIYINSDRPDLEAINSSVTNCVIKFKSRINITNLKKDNFTTYSRDLCVDIINSFNNPNDKLKINIIDEINTLYRNITNETTEICGREHLFSKKFKRYTEDICEILLFTAIPVFFTIRFYAAYQFCLNGNLNNNFDNNVEEDGTNSLIQTIIFMTI